MKRLLLLIGLLAGCPAQRPPEPLPEARELPPLPEVGAPTPWAPPVPHEVRTATGDWGLLVVPQADLPLVSVRLVVPTGSVDDPAGAWGTAALAGEMMEQSAGDLDTLERAAALSLLGADLWVGVGRDQTVVALDVHQDRLEEALPLLADSVFRPTFSETDWERVRDRHLGALRQRGDDPGAIARAIGPRVLHGDDHPYGSVHDGTRETVSALEREAVEAWTHTHLRPEGAWFVVVGAVAPKEIEGALAAAFADWSPGDGERAPPAPPTPRSGVFLVDHPRATQTTVHLLRPGPPATAEDAVALELARILVGGTYTSRLNQRLREEKGVTYGAHMTVRSFRAGGMVRSGAAVRADATGASLQDFYEVLGGAGEPGTFSPEEVAQARAQLRTAIVEAVETRGAHASRIARAVGAGRPPDDLRRRLEEATALGPEALAEAARRWLVPDDAAVLLVGDADTLLPLLRERGLPEPTLLDPDGAPLAP